MASLPDPWRRNLTLVLTLVLLAAYPVAATEPAEPDPEPASTWPPPLASATVRPGVQHVTSGAQCTTNFVFRDLVTDRLFIGTAAHCVRHVGIGATSFVRTISGGTGIPAKVAFTTSGTRIGTDFALLEIPKDREKDVHPAVIGFGGPTHLANLSTVNTGDKVVFYGNSGLRPGNTPLDHHEGYVVGKNPSFTRVWTVTPGIPGDSGSGLMTMDGGAIGAASTIEFFPVTGRNAFGNVHPAVTWLNENGWQLELQTWPLIGPQVLPGPLG